jgi:hypothetical protein
MKQGKKIQTTRKYFRRKFIRVILVMIFLAFIPVLLIFIYQNTLGRNEDNLPDAGKFLCSSRNDVDVSEFVANGGSAAIIDETLSVTPLGGEAIFDKSELTTEEWTKFLLNCDEINGSDYDVAFNQGEDNYWLVLRKPRAIEFSLSLHLNSSAPSSSSGGSWKCSCGNENSGKFCSNCGSPKPLGKRKCPSCGAENEGRFCSECGTPLQQ